MSVWYLDSSAIVKFVVAEKESQALGTWRRSLDSEDLLMTSELAVAEVIRAVRRVGVDANVAVGHLDSIDQLVMDRDLMLAAGGVDPPDVRTLDAIHLASALAAGDELVGVVTYDSLMADAARQLGLPVLAPGTDGNSHPSLRPGAHR